MSDFKSFLYRKSKVDMDAHTYCLHMLPVIFHPVFKKHWVWVHLPEWWERCGKDQRKQKNYLKSSRIGISQQQQNMLHDVQGKCELIQ